MPHRFGINLAPNSADKKCDALIIISYDDKLTFTRELEQYRKLIDEQKEFDIKYQIEGGMIVLPNSSFKRLIYTPVGPIDRDFDDVRTFMDAATRGLSRALKAGARMPLIILPSNNGFHEQYSLYDLAILLGVYQILYVPLENREFKNLTKVDFIDFTNFCDVKRETKIMELAKAIECGRGFARDIGGSDPERMSASNTAKYVEALFENSSVKVEIISDLKIIEKEFPCLAAVNRASVDRHAARVIFLSYEPEETPEKTLFLVGKGVTYDTGGCDIKSGGVMAGMHRDKCGAAAVAGFLETVNKLKPKKIRVYGAMAMVRNSIGPNGYVADELIVSRAGVRIRIGNTDAEGRMAMVDLLTYYKEKIIAEQIPNPEMFTIATLTGHCCMAVGFDYSIILDNGPARKKRTAQLIQEAGDRVGDLFEISTIRREDFKFNEGKSEYEEILQSNNAPSSRTPRGHQIPAAFLIQVSKLDQHGIDSDLPIPFSHIDIAGSSGSFPGVPTGAPIAALTARYLIGEF
ncbi:dipeptidase B [Dermatophagoides farinae]|uniref:Aminopeptidase-like protein 6 n=1 Tax=Dermatophagoides farinae TaxID=6954 RepID=A0A922IES6_DERFA|nr:putative aminopeptidase W07G4.4 [Dermatophagoides farinae]KAH7642586.1 aminopeptidase-like protein 6 [Dermatophagoides farinae]KAH9529895.1 Cytosol aminopeptidase, catalytic domain [Dermatophagoides farinae]KAH9529896.1 Cytosol aminopeptidase, catalytic domain, variant 2 [Dermatophagoides farinae]